MKTIIVVLLALSAGVFAQTLIPKTDPAPSPVKIQYDGFGAIHGIYVSWFVESKGFGNSRMPVVRSHPPTEWNVGEDKYVVKTVNLIGIVNHKEPVVYLNLAVHENMVAPDMVHKGDEQVRKLNEFESAALKQFIEKKTDVVNDSNTRIVGAIRAQTSCINCHDVKEGDLMGAFSYLLYKDIPLVK